MPNLKLRAELDDTRIGSMHVAVLAMAMAAVMFDGYDILIIGYSLPQMSKEWALTPPMAGALVSAGVLGLAFSSMIGGVLADRFGRRPTLIGALMLSGLGSMATAKFANSYSEFLLLRVITGLGLGTLLPLASVYVREFSPARTSALFVGICQLGFGLGGALSSVLGIAITPHYGWRGLFWIGGVGIAFAVVYLGLFPESPEYLAARSQRTKLVQLMVRLNPQRAAEYQDATFEIDDNRQQKGLRVLLGRGARWNTICVWLAAFFLVLATYGTTGWMPSLMISRGSSHIAGFALGGLLVLASTFGSVLIAALADRVHSPRMTILSTLTLGGAFFLALSWTSNEWGVTALVFGMGFLILGTHPTLYSFVASLYPTEVRASGVGAMLFVGRMGGLCGPILGGFLLQEFGTSIAPFSAFAVAVLLCAGLVLLTRPPALAPRTKPGIAETKSDQLTPQRS